MKDGAVADFYDRIGPMSRDNMGWDWDAETRRQGKCLGGFLMSALGRPGPFEVLDCTCGIGTQAIGLALEGHRVQASDLSAVSIAQARQEADRLGLAMSFCVADFRSLEAEISETFDVVLSCDNAIAHCLRDEDLAAALASIETRLDIGGLLLLSLRDYDALLADKRRFNNEHVEDRPDGRRVVFQLWDWAEDGRSYRNHQFLIRETDGDYELNHFATELRVLLRDEILGAVTAAGYADAHWHPPEASGYYQPIVTARKR